MENIKSRFGLHQVIKELTDLTYILDTSSSCIKLIFTSQTNSVMFQELIHLYIKIVIIKKFL